jgi:hypothetical protein
MLPVMAWKYLKRQFQAQVKSGVAATVTLDPQSQAIMDMMMGKEYPKRMFKLQSQLLREAAEYVYGRVIENIPGGSECCFRRWFSREGYARLRGHGQTP